MTHVPFKDVVRWIAVLPGSVACAVAATFPIHWGMLLINYILRERGDISYFPQHTFPISVAELFAYALFIPFFVIAFGAKIAPRYKFQTGLTLAILFGVLIGYEIGTILVPEVKEGLYNMSRWLRFAITIVLWSISIIWGIYSAYMQDKGLHLKRAKP
ncbi:MAG: hypothetical protein ACYDB9_03445 [Gammaproteobacteria bacterium]